MYVHVFARWVGFQMAGARPLTENAPEEVNWYCIVGANCQSRLHRHMLSDHCVTVAGAAEKCTVCILSIWRNKLYFGGKG